MRQNSTVEQAVGSLLGLVDGETAERVRARTGLPSPERPKATAERLRRAWTWATHLPASVALWILENDDPELNAVVWRYISTDSGLRRAIARGVPFGPGRAGTIPVDRTLPGAEDEIPESYVRHGLVGSLREVDSMAAGRAAASMVLTRADWQTVGEADAVHPLPGYARWALSVRPDCPPLVREPFGSHAKFRHRLRQAGVYDSPAEYVMSEGPAIRVLEVLAMGHVLFPNRVQEAENALRPLVREHLGDREEAWAVLAQLVESFHGNVPELVVTAGAIA
ncbi:hypothetical protein [Streptomyces sp. WM6386]|uniref:hypothetical protein n=1 Tax=Streptomyces sp. WM6386 TaxID=1415558 RepID=UPI00061913CA|nr:hypothetical protein [Streptomyces sp. WM6386]KKD09873.1 hypothetical protein TN53_00850 [Streptomyces sp. WM6386]